MTASAAPRQIQKLVLAELARVPDPRVASFITERLVFPTSLICDWDYGEPGQQFECWIVMRDADCKVAIAYCDEGFGPGCPWGLIWYDPDTSGRIAMGMDSEWFTTFLAAFFDSPIAIPLPIWRVFEFSSLVDPKPITEEGDWKGMWHRVESLRADGGVGRYYLDQTVVPRE